MVPVFIWKLYCLFLVIIWDEDKAYTLKLIILECPGCQIVEEGIEVDTVWVEEEWIFTNPCIGLVNCKHVSDPQDNIYVDTSLKDES